MKYIIKDWANNTLKNGHNGLQFEFDSFEGGWAFIYETFETEDFEDLFVLPEGENV